MNNNGVIKLARIHMPYVTPARLSDADLEQVRLAEREREERIAAQAARVEEWERRHRQVPSKVQRHCLICQRSFWTLECHQGTTCGEACAAKKRAAIVTPCCIVCGRPNRSRKRRRTCSADCYGRWLTMSWAERQQRLR